MRIDGTDNPESWEAIYQAGDAGWDIGKPAPPFQTLLEKPPEWLKPAKLICFGAGAGHDSNFFAEKGFEVTAADFAPSAIKAIEKYADSNNLLTALECDILSLPIEHQKKFEYVLEHTCFCALPIDNRKEYVKAAKKALKPGGILFGLFYRFDPPDEKGPPFHTSEEEIKGLFSDDFEFIEWSTPKNSHRKRQNRERFIAMKVKI
ncbi:MAG: TPMT family class I SAM-dependent methyltransferase [Lentisphaeraceae bacterium]|nr:TPMT family class I SAM-dependent methyltransferase [Lentisphaeraceae bacterium]